MGSLLMPGLAVVVALAGARFDGAVLLASLRAGVGVVTTDGVSIAAAAPTGATGEVVTTGRELRSGGATTQPVRASVAIKINKCRIGPNYPRKLSFCFRIVANASAFLHCRNGLVCRSIRIVDGTVASDRARCADTYSNLS